MAIQDPDTYVPEIIPFEYRRDYRDFILIEIDRFDQPMTKTLLSFLGKRYGKDYWWCIDISGNQRIDAYVIAGPEKDTEENNVVHIYSIAIRRDLEGQGWMRKLMKHLIDQARDDNKEKIILEVRENNVRAIRFYEGLEFNFTAKEENYYDNDIDALKYELLL